MRPYSSINVAVIGLGIGASHALSLAVHPKVNLVTVCDHDSTRLLHYKSKLPSTTEITDNHYDIINNDNIDLVVIASYDNYHSEHIAQALGANKHVFCEKPLCQTIDEAKSIRDLLTNKPYLKLGCNFILRTHNRFIELKNNITSGHLGQIFYIDGDYNYGRIGKLTSGWRGEIPYYSVMGGGASHIIDLMLWITGDKVTEVTSTSNKLATHQTNFKFPDLSVGLLKFKKGAVAKVSANFANCGNHFHELKVYGTDATFVNTYSGGTYSYLREVNFEGETQNPYTVFQKDQHPHLDKSALLIEFINSLINDEPQPINHEEIFSVLDVVFALEEASKSEFFSSLKLA